jgi:transglutaminase-like putative cysteine protease
MASFALLLTPQWDRLPVWLVVACCVLAIWRWLAQFGRARLPGRWLRMAIMFVLTVIYVVGVKGHFTVDTAASFFILAVGLKWLETRSVRDFYVLFFILIYLAAVNFLFHQEILWTLVNFAAIALLLVGIQILNAPDLPKGMQSGWRRLGSLFLKVLPVVVLLFIFFPRMAPLWSVPLVSGEARTGISDTMSPGDISNLAQSSKRAFRVTFGGAIPAYRDRYWRGLILDRLEGETWKQGESIPFQGLDRMAIDGGIGELQSDEYDVLLEPTDQHWAFALANSRAVSANVVKDADDLFRFRRPADSTVRYRLGLYARNSDVGTSLSATEQRKYLQLPAEGNPRTRAFAQQLGESLSDVDVVRSLLSRFRNQEYFYTLRPPRMPDDGIDALLFDVKRGFCAHYAGATVFALRAAGIPSRIVIGYQGGESGASGDYLIVRQYDAHAWVEVWLSNRGWIRIDPTAAIAPERIESGLRDAVADEGSFLENEWASLQRYGDVPVLQWASLQLDRLSYQWQRWVVGYQGQSQMNLMSHLPGGFGLRELGYLTAGIVGLGLLLAGLMSAWQSGRGRGRSRKDKVWRLVQRWHALCAKAGVPVRTGETPVALALRLADAVPAAAVPARVFAHRVNRYYYSAKADAGSIQAADLKYMRRLLAAMQRQIRIDRPQRPNSTAGQIS